MSFSTAKPSVNVANESVCCCLYYKEIAHISKCNSTITSYSIYHPSISNEGNNQFQEYFFILTKIFSRKRSGY